MAPLPMAALHQHALPLRSCCFASLAAGAGAVQHHVLSSKRALGARSSNGAAGLGPRRPFKGGATQSATCCLASLTHGGSAAPRASQHDGYAHDLKELVGVWVKDREASDSMSAAMDLMALGGIIRQAVKLIRGIEISQDATTWTMAVFSVIGWFKVTERYKLDGSPSQCKRRDLRGGNVETLLLALAGKHTGALLPGKPGPHGGLQLTLQWDEPHGGTGLDEFVLAPRGTAAAEKQQASAAAASTSQAAATNPKQAPQASPAGEQELHVYSLINVRGTPCRYRTVYRRKRRGGQPSPQPAR